MTYAHRKDIYDVDTHMMEHPNWIYNFADKNKKSKFYSENFKSLLGSHL